VSVVGRVLFPVKDGDGQECPSYNKSGLSSMNSCPTSLPMKFQLSAAPATLPHSKKKLQSRNVAAVSRPSCFEPRGSKVEDFGLETAATSANRRNRVKFQSFRTAFIYSLQFRASFAPHLR